MPFPVPASGSTAPPVATAPPRTPAFSAGAVIGRSFSVWFRNFVAFSLVTLVVYLPALVLAALAPANGGPGWALADQILSGLSSLAATGALTYGVLQSLDGGRVGIGALFRVGFRKMGWVFLVSFAVGLWVLLGTILLVVPAIIWYCGLYAAIPAVVVEADVGVSGALSRSRSLTKGHRWAIFAVVLVVLVVTVAAAGGGGVLVALVGNALPPPVPALLVGAVVALASSFGSCASAVAYHDLRVEKEGVATADLVKVFE
jgi:hypothetical protein